MKKRAILIAFLFSLVCFLPFAQSVGIGSNEFRPDESAILELRSDTKGLLIPRLTRDQRNRISSPSTGLMIYQTDGTPGFFYYDGSQWAAVLTHGNLPVDDDQIISFDPVSYRLSLENGGTVDLSILRNGRSLESTIDNGDGTITFNYNDGTSFTTSDLRGPKGDIGPPGQDANTILTGTIDPSAGTGQVGDIYINTTSDFIFGPKDLSGWGPGQSLVGAPGRDGQAIRTGTSNPTIVVGNDGDFYINTNTNTLFGPKTAGAWGSGTSLIGPAGADGVDGTNGTNGTNGLDGQSLLNGSTDPIAATGNDGDFYVNTTNSTIFGPKTAGAWGAGISLVGPAGTNGVNGTNGTNGSDGVDGQSLLNGNTDPIAATGNDGDFYINTTSSTIFGPKTAGAWGAGISLVGPAGTDGIDGINGTNGTNGVDGVDGKTILNGSVNPTAGVGTDGDFYLNTSSLSIFGPKTGGLWGAGTSLNGVGIQSSSDNPDGSITFNFTDGSSFTSQPDGDFSSTNELITNLNLAGKIFQITESGVTRNLDLSSLSGSDQITDSDNNTTVTVDEAGANDDIIRFKTGGAESMRLNGRTLEFLNNSGSIAIGENTAMNNTGAGNLAVGTEASFLNTTGRFNVALGYRALRQNSTGQGNVAIGYNAGFNETGSNKLYIDNSNTNSPLLWGDFANDIVNVNGKLGIGLTTPGSITDELEVNGHATVISLTQTSDQRLKKNITPVSNALQKIQSITGVTYDWRKNEFPERRFRDGKQIGFIAQELQQTFPELISQSSDGFYSVSYAGITPVLVEAIKEQQTTIKQLEQLISELKKDIAETKKALSELQKKSK